jgi:hypothetical protein
MSIHHSIELWALNNISLEVFFFGGRVTAFNLEICLARFQVADKGCLRDGGCLVSKQSNDESTLPLFLRFSAWILEMLRQSGILFILFYAWFL